jgi:predicted DNA-binding antitoxin AbrB/MazE fold protein
MPLEIDAIYENGMLRPERDLPLENGQRVRLTIESRGGHARSSYGLMGWKGDPAVIEQVAIDPEFGILESP